MRTDLMLMAIEAAEQIVILGPHLQLNLLMDYINDDDE